MPSPGARSEARDSKATKRPSALIAGRPESPLPPRAEHVAGDHAIVTRRRSKTKTSAWPLSSPETRLEAVEEKATKRPSSLTTGSVETPLAGPRPTPRLTRTGRPPARSAAKTSIPGRRRYRGSTRREVKTSQRPSGVMRGPVLASSPLPPPGVEETTALERVRLSRTTIWVLPLGASAEEDVAKATRWPSALMTGGSEAVPTPPRVPSAADETRNVGPTSAAEAGAAPPRTAPHASRATAHLGMPDRVGGARCIFQAEPTSSGVGAVSPPWKVRSPTVYLAGRLR